MLLETKRFYDFGEFRIDLSERSLLREGQVIRLTPKVFETLCVLVESAGRTLSKDELMERIWEGQFVEESNLAFNVGRLRKALGDDASKPTFIETVPKRGYRFIARIAPGLADDEISYKSADSESPNLRHIAPHNSETEPSTPRLVGQTNSTGEKGSFKLFAAISSLFSARPLILSVTVVVFGMFFLTGSILLRNKPSFYERFETAGSRFLVVQNLSDGGDADNINISSDGKFFVDSSTEGGKNTIWLRLAATGKSVPIFTSVNESFHGLAFSHGGEYIYFAHQRPEGPLQLSRISILGGTPTLILNNIHSGWSFSPDESHVAFTRFDEAARIMIADADGGNEFEISSNPRSRYVFGINWSPDGSAVGFCASTSSKVPGRHMDFGIYKIDLADRTESSMTDFKWDWLEGFKWLPDQSGLLVTASQGAVEPTQIWRVGLPSGKADQITKDSSSLSLRGASADFSQLLASQSSRLANVWIMPITGSSSDARPIARGQYDVEWTTDGRLIYEASEPDSTDLWQMGIDGGEKRQLTVNNSFERSPTASPDGRYIVYVSALKNGQQNIWRMDADGGDQRQLTNGEGGEIFPAFTRDSKSVVYNSMRDGSLWIIPVEGGEPQELSKEKTRRISISPDGKQFAYFGFADNKGKLIIKTFPECVMAREFDAVFNAAALPRIVWKEGGKSVMYEINDSRSVGNIWEQSVLSGETKQLTNFTSERISNFALSPDKKNLAIVRGNLTFEAVLLTGSN